MFFDEHHMHSVYFIRNTQLVPARLPFHSGIAWIPQFMDWRGNLCAFVSMEPKKTEQSGMEPTTKNFDYAQVFS